MSNISINPIIAQAKQLLYYGENVPEYEEILAAAKEERTRNLFKELEEVKGGIVKEKARLEKEVEQKTALVGATISLERDRRSIQEQLEALKSEETASQDLLQALGTMHKTSSLSYRAMAFGRK